MIEEIYEIEMVTVEEEKAIKNLQRVAEKWPQTLSLFSWNGTLVVTKMHPEHPEDEQGRVVDTIIGIDNDGGDPNFKKWDDD